MAKESGTENISAENLLSVVLESAVDEGASDIHIEPLGYKLRIRLRVDGRLQEKWARPLAEFEPIVNRIKVLADLDLITKPTPQDGHFELIETEAQVSEHVSGAGKSIWSRDLADLFSKEGGKESDSSKISGSVSVLLPSREKEAKGRPRVVDVRVSIFPTSRGEAVVLRLLNRVEMIMALDKFEMDSDTLLRVRKLISKNYGMVLVTGPSNSGKTSMLYSILRELKSKEKNIVTLEDPVEFDLEDIRQIQIRAGLSFAVGMKSILRQDPDIIMIGEIRDPETAEHAVRAALVARTVFSTVHSNSSIGIIARLIDMGVDRSLIAYALHGAVSKRLVRKICPDCRIAYNPPEQYLKAFGLTGAGYKFQKGKGCDKCNNTGYKGRMGLFEVMELDDNLRSLILEKAPMKALQDYLEKINMKTLKQDAVEKILAGKTTIEEAIGAV